jgi:hypothetical protein
MNCEELWRLMQQEELHRRSKVSYPLLFTAVLKSAKNGGFILPKDPPNSGGTLPACRAPKELRPPADRKAVTCPFQDFDDFRVSLDSSREMVSLKLKKGFEIELSHSLVKVREVRGIVATVF